MAKTLEQIQAELEALKTQFTDFSALSPVSYYTHQYSGEEIDQAVTRALPNGAIDQAVGTLVRPNLLDNWYFGRPVDQRGGYVAPPGVAYKDVNTGTTVGTTTAYYKVTQFSDNNAIIQISGTNYFVQPGGYVRGYIPAWNGYSIDRWSVEAERDLVITLVDNGVHVKNRANQGRQLKQILPSELKLAGKMVTISILCGDVVGSVNYALSQTSSPYQNSALCRLTKAGLFSATGSVLTGQQKIMIVLDPGAEITILAAKLELGPTQTLARQENGQWVLNEVPDYGEQLLRCKRYCRVYKAGTTLPCLAYPELDGGWYASAGLPTNSMRTIPTNNLGGGKKCAIVDLDGSDSTHDDMSMMNWGQNGNMLCLRISGGTHGPLTSKFPYYIRPKEDLILSADL